MLQQRRMAQQGCRSGARSAPLNRPLAVPTNLIRSVPAAGSSHVPAALPEQASSTSGWDVFSSRRGVLLVGGLLSVVEALSVVPVAQATEGITKVFVAGATGGTGRRVVAALRAAGYEVRAGVRDIKKGQALGLGLDTGVTLVTADVLKGQALLEEAIGDAQAVICATGYTGFNPKGFGDVDETGTKSLVDAAKAKGVKHFVLLSSLLTNAPAVGQSENPNYKFLNLFGQVLDHKLVAERYLRGSGLTWTVVRPGGLSNEPPAKVGNLITQPEDTLFGLDSDPGREISRDTVAEVLVASLGQGAAQNKVVEIVSSPSAPVLPKDRWFPA